MEGIQSMLSNDDSIIKLGRLAIGVFKFLFFSWVGKIILLIVFFVIIAYNVRDKNGRISFLSTIKGLSEFLLWVTASLGTLIVVIAFIISTYTLYRKIDTFVTQINEYLVLKKALKNVKLERKLVECDVNKSISNGQPVLYVNIRYYSYYPVKEETVLVDEKSYSISGTYAYIDFGVINFDYSLIESGKSINIAYPYRLYSDRVEPQHGVIIYNFSTNGVPVNYEIDQGDLYLIDKNEYDLALKRLFEAVQDKNKARKMGIRTAYGNAFRMDPIVKTHYKFYVNGSGGMIAR